LVPFVEIGPVLGTAALRAVEAVEHLSGDEGRRCLTVGHYFV
jgi:hypothetical protein